MTTDTLDRPSVQAHASAPRRAPRREGSVGAAIGANALLIVLSLLSVFPLYWALSTSFLPAADINGGVQKIFPDNPTIQNYIDLFTQTQFWNVMKNSAIISIVVTVFGTVFAAAAGYAFGKLSFRGRDAIFLVMLLTMMIPPLVTVPVNFIVMSQLGLINTLWAVIIPQLAPAFGIFWMRQYAIGAIPDTVIEAAQIDGAGTLRTFWQIGMPMMRPGLAGLAIYLFMMSWNQFLLPLTYLQSNENQTYTVFLSNLNSSYAAPQTNLALATSMLSTIPLLLIFIFGQRHFVAGVTSGAVKG